MHSAKDVPNYLWSTALVFHLNACVYRGVVIRMQMITLDSRLEFKADF